MRFSRNGPMLMFCASWTGVFGRSSVRVGLVSAAEAVSGTAWAVVAAVGLCQGPSALCVNACEYMCVCAPSLFLSLPRSFALFRFHRGAAVSCRAGTSRAGLTVATCRFVLGRVPLRVGTCRVGTSHMPVIVRSRAWSHVSCMPGSTPPKAGEGGLEPGMHDTCDQARLLVLTGVCDVRRDTCRHVGEPGPVRTYT